MSQLPILIEDYGLQQYDRIQAVFSAAGKVIHVLTRLEKWRMMDQLCAALNPGTPAGQWRELDKMIGTIETAAIDEKNVQALMRLDRVREVANG